MKNQSIWFLENIDVSGIFCENKMGEAINTHSHKTYNKNDYIYLPEQAADKIYFIIEGSVKIGSLNEQNKEITKAILGKGELFGELSLIGQEKRRDFALAMEQCTLCILTVEEMKSMLKDHNALSLFFMRIMGSRVLDMEQRLESMVFKDSRSRIVEYIADLVNKKGQRVGYEWVVRKFITHQEIANLTATSRQTVTTVLNDLRNKNLLTFNRKRLLVRDLEKLKEQIV